MNTQYITAGLASVTPEIRQGRLIRERTRHLSDLEVKEQAIRDSYTVAPDGNFDTTDNESQLGRPMTSDDVKRRLGKLNKNLHYEVSSADTSKLGIYVIENRPDSLGVMQKGKRFVVGMQNGWMPEFSIRHYVNENVPNASGEWEVQKKFTKETRGWRTVLARLIKEKLITRAKADAYFAVNAGRSSRNWQAQIS